MDRLIATEEFWELWEEAQNGRVENWENFEGILTLPQELGTGQLQVIQLRDGLRVEVDDIELWNPVHLDEYLPESQELFFGFYLCGSFRIINPGLKTEQDRVEGSGENCLCFLHDIQKIEYFPAQQRIQRVMFGVGLDFLRSFGSCWDVIPTPLQRLIEGKEIQRFHQTLGTTTQAMQQALQQILHCPYQGAIRQMYLEGKAMELLALQLMQWAKDEQKSYPTLKLRQDDIQRLHHARDILNQKLDNPPTLLDLARQVGLNDHKLKHGFRHIFGNSVFGYFRNCQMEQAQYLLAETQMNVTEVAHAVGYASVPSFSTAFRKKFGVSPSTYRNQL